MQSIKSVEVVEGKRTGYLDGWRGISIICVLQGHFANQAIDLGGFGVSMFFCLSGMLMGNILFLERQNLGIFYRRRISRIAPAFLLFVAVTFALSWLWNTTFDWREFTATLFFFRTYYPTPGIWESALPIGHIWSLNVEEHSYVFMSLLTLCAVLRGREGCFLIGCGFVCICIGFLYARMATWAPPWGALGSEVAASFLLVSAGYRLVCGSFRRWIPPYLPIAALALSVFLSEEGPWWGHRLVSPFLLAMAVNHLSESYGWFTQKLLSTKFLRTAGLASFSIYLWQQPFYSYKTSFPGGAGCALVCAVGVSVLSFMLVEQPCRRWLNEHWGAPPR